MKYILAGFMVALAMVSHGSVVYQELFDGPSGDYFVSKSPDVTTDSKTWKGATVYVYTGAGSTTSTVNDARSTFIDFSPEPGKIYTLNGSLMMNPAESGQTVSFAIGFISTNNAAGNMNWWGNADSPWIRISSGGALGAMIGNSNPSGTVYGQVTNRFNTYTIVLDTTADQWTATFTVNGFNIGASSTYTYTVNPDIVGVGFGMSGSVDINMTSEIAAFELSEVVPSDTVFSEAFGGIPGASFVGAEPDVTTDGTIWSGSTSYVLTDSGTAASTVNDKRSAYLEFVPTSGKVYTLSAPVVMDPEESGLTVPFAVGFISSNNASSTMNWFSNADSPWIKIGSTGGLGAMVGNSQPSGTIFAGVTNVSVYSIVLDTTGDDWTASYTVNGFNIGSSATYTYSVNPDIVGVGFGMSGSGAVNMTAEVTAFELSVLVSDVGYSGWISGYSVGTATNMLDDADGDGLSNLAEFGLGGDPSDGADAGYPSSVSVTADNGTNWLEYVYAMRADAADRGLTYSVEKTSDLVSGTWTNAGVIPAGSGSLDSGDFESVTNRVLMDSEPQQFVRIKIVAE